MARLEPVVAEAIGPDDPFYTLNQLADSQGGSLSNDEIDEIIYGQ